MPHSISFALSVFGLMLGVLLSHVGHADIAAEPLNRNRPLGPAGAHWAWYLDFKVDDISNSRFVLFDADTAGMKGSLGSGAFPTMHASPDGRFYYVAESWLRGPRRIREDFVTIYDDSTLQIDGIIELPGARRALMSPRDRTVLTADGSLLLVFNFTPSTSLTVIDLASRTIKGDVPTPGCSLAYPTSSRGVSMICGDGSLLTIHFGSDGTAVAQHRSKPFFDPDKDPLIENGVSLEGVWYFTTYGGQAHSVDLRGEKPVFGSPWPLVDQNKKPANFLASLFTMGKAGPWLPGGFQILTVHESTRRLYALTHPITWSEGKGDHVFPGAEVWVYDIDEQKRIDRIKLRDVGISIHVTPDESPLLLVGAVDIKTEEFRLEVYDAESGDFLRELEEPGEVMFHFQGVSGR